MPFITDIEQVQQYVTIDSSIELDKLTPYFNRVERDLQELIGKDLLLKISSSDNSEPKNYVCEYITCLGLSKALNALKLKISNTGIKLSSPQMTDNPNWWDIKDLNRDLISTSNRSLNYLLKFFDENKENFKEWDDSPIQKSQEDLLVKDLKDFENYFSINGSFLTLLALRPFIRDTQIIKIKKQLQDCFNSSELSAETLNNLKGALVNYTIASVADSGLFKLEENGAIVKIELMPWEKSEQISDLRLDRLKDQRNEIAENYLKDALKEISKLPCFKNSPEPELLAIKKKSMLFIGKSNL